MAFPHKTPWYKLVICVIAFIGFALLSVFSRNLVIKEFSIALASATFGVLLCYFLFRRVGSFDRVISGNIWRQLAVLFGATLFLLVVVLIMVGVIPSGEKGASDNLFNRSFAERLVETTHRFLGYNYYPEDAGATNFWLLIVSLVGSTLMGGLVVATLSNIIQQRKEDVNHGLVRYKGVSDHYVLIGYDQFGIPLIRELFANHPGTSLLIMSSLDSQAIRTELETIIDSKDIKRIHIYSGSMFSEEHIRELNIKTARAVYIMGDGDAEGKDSKNIECARILKQCRWNGVGTKPEVLPIHISLSKATTFSTIRSLSFPKEYYMTNGQTVTYLRPFNFYENCAHGLWGPLSQERYEPLDFIKISENSATTVHLVIAGFNDMGRALLLEALRICHFPNYKGETGNNKTKVTIVDPLINSLWPTFQSQYLGIEYIEDVEIDRHPFKIEDHDMREYLELWSRQKDTLLTVAICFYDPDTSFSSALHLPESLYYQFDEKKTVLMENRNVRILVRQKHIPGIGDVMNHSGVRKYQNVKMFGSFEDGLRELYFDDTKPMLVNAFYAQKYYNENANDNQNEIIRYFRTHFALGDEDFWEYMHNNPAAAFSLARQLWYVLNEDLRYANRYQIEMYDIFNKYENESGDNTHLMRMEHLRWCAERRIVGYTLFPYTSKTGLVDGVWNDAYKQFRHEFKFHKLLISYENLPQKEKNKDQDVIQNRKQVVSAMNDAKLYTTDEGFVVTISNCSKF